MVKKDLKFIVELRLLDVPCLKLTPLIQRTSIIHKN